MKKILLFVLGVLLTQSLFASEKEYKIKLKNSAENKIRLDIDQTDLTIEGYKGNEVLIKVQGEFRELPERAQGLKPLTRLRDNTGVGLAMQQEGNTLFLAKAMQGKIKIEMKVPENVALNIQESSFFDDNTFSLKSLKGEIEVKGKNATIRLEDVYGPVIANTTSGDIYCAYAELIDRPHQLSCTSGVLEVVLPKNSKVDLSLKTYQGEVYTDFDIVSASNKKSSSPVAMYSLNNFKGTINGGGTSVHLQATSNDIYLRQSK
ncbi:DUF4097 family beta strand repeat-containing protein [Sediminitomix flava]|uniref:Adhesin n=1 Tax=Sediminitomix flava TaxID=379075 RepID=A0A315ZJ04_SEDFL|nr:hypothetical protein [Sediminitomix flava]PWJ45070.1 hypothetical protein BC781_1011474 [Sediminitomix flava]